MTATPGRPLLRLRQIQSGIRRKEVEWPQLEGVPHGGHHRPILHARHVVEAKRVPTDEVGIFNRPVCLRPDRKAIGAAMASQSEAHVRMRVVNPLTNVANARLAEKIVERIAHHATVDPDGWEAFAAAKIKLALDAAARRPQ
jgi:hypothetical protein